MAHVQLSVWVKDATTDHVRFVNINTDQHGLTVTIAAGIDIVIDFNNDEATVRVHREDSEGEEDISEPFVIGGLQ